MTRKTADKAKKKKPSAKKQSNSKSDITNQVVKLRAHVRESIGKITLAMMSLPRYQDQSIRDLQHLVLDPLIRDRIAIAYPKAQDEQGLGEISGIAIWAKVSEEVDAKIREQVNARIWPLRLKAEDWMSGEIAWLIDVIAPDEKTTTSVLANFKQVVGDAELRVHPFVVRLLDPETVKRLMKANADVGEEQPESEVEK